MNENDDNAIQVGLHFPFILSFNIGFAAAASEFAGELLLEFNNFDLFLLRRQQTATPSGEFVVIIWRQGGGRQAAS